MLDKISNPKNLKKIHMETMADIYLKNEDIDPVELSAELKRYCDRTNDDLIIVEKRFNKEVDKLQSQHPELLSVTSDLYTSLDMEKPWEIIEDLGYMVYQDNASTKNLFYVKSFNRINGRKRIFNKSDDKSLIPLINSWAYQQNTMWNKPIKYNGATVGFDETIVDFRDANLTRFAHKTVVFNPTTEDDVIKWEGAEALNSYSAPTILSKARLNNVDNCWPLELADFFRLVWNLVDGDDQGQLYVINWLSRNYQVRDLAQTLIWFCGEGGTGKGILMDLISNIYGSEFIGKGSPENNIFTSKENNSLKNTLYYHGDELNLQPEDYDQIKAFVSNRTFSLKANFENVRDYPNYAAFIFNSNTRKGQIPFALPSLEDRRVTAFDTFTPLSDCKWWNYKITPDKFKYDSKFAEAVAQFFADFNYNDRMISFPFKNDLRTRMTTAGKQNMTLFSEALANRDMDWFHNMGLDTFDWLNTDGRKASAYTWEEHLTDAFEDGYIRTVSAKMLYQLIFNDRDYKKEEMQLVGIFEKNKRIDVKGDIKQAKVFILPSEDIEDIEVLALEEADWAISMKPAKKGRSKAKREEV